MMVTTMRLHAPRSSRRGGLLALALLCLLSAVHGLFFYVHKEVRLFFSSFLRLRIDSCRCLNCSRVFVLPVCA